MDSLKRVIKSQNQSLSGIKSLNKQLGPLSGSTPLSSQVQRQNESQDRDLSLHSDQIAIGDSHQVHDLCGDIPVSRKAFLHM